MILQRRRGEKVEIGDQNRNVKPRRPVKTRMMRMRTISLKDEDEERRPRLTRMRTRPLNDEDEGRRPRRTRMRTRPLKDEDEGR